MENICAKKIHEYLPADASSGGCDFRTQTCRPSFSDAGHLENGSTSLLPTADAPWIVSRKQLEHSCVGKFRLSLRAVMLLDGSCLSAATVVMMVIDVGAAVEVVGNSPLPSPCPPRLSVRPPPPLLRPPPRPRPPPSPPRPPPRPRPTRPAASVTESLEGAAFPIKAPRMRPPRPPCCPFSRPGCADAEVLARC
jgi:hypothetical protein